MKQKSKPKTNISKPFSIKSRKARKKSPKIIDYNKVAQKYGNLLETSLNVSNSTQPQKALNGNNNIIDDSYYDYIIDNIYETNNINQYLENSKNNDSSYYFTFKQKKASIINSNNNSSINIAKNKKKNRLPISIMSNKEEINKYFNDRNNINNINNISSIKNYNNNYNTFSKQIKKTKSLKTNMSYKNDIMTEKNKKIEKIIYTNYKTNKSYNNIKIKENKKINNDFKDIKDKLKPKKLNRINSQENNFSKKFNINNSGNIYKNNHNYESIQVYGNDSIKKDMLERDKNKNEYYTKLKEKVLLLLNLCRKYANKFNKLFPLCESALSNNCKNQSLDELKNTISQFNNMIFNKNISKIFDLNENQNDLLNILNNEETQKINELSEKLDNLRKNELIQQKKINNLSQKIEILNNEIENKDNIIKDLKNKLNMKIPGKIKEFHGLIENNDEIKTNPNIKLNENNSNKKSNKRDVNKNININSYNKMSNQSKNNNKEKYQIDEIKNNINNNKLNFEIDENQPLNTEIEKLDKEIFNLKSKLKKIIQK